MDDMHYKIETFIRQQLLDRSSENGINPEDIRDNFELIESGLIDSMGFIELFAAIEQEFDIVINFEEMDPSTLTTFQGFVSFCTQQTNMVNTE